ncbi:Auxin response factor 13 [Dichanthelium oligosanthes]|uniref:Auxin response factor n=1 Tax=Dichanthelium oligosanthes TaxID=888268 RepID=A0A1E5WJL1_9POAL|nr:Auxin response factor 13 [Dichanthelium oligosanthes]
MEAQPPPATVVDRDVWLACAVPLSRLPVVGAEVYYFPHGHAEQCPEHLPAPLPTPHIFPCVVTAISLGADDKTNEVFAQISLKPGPHRGPAAPAPDADPTNPQQQQLSYFAKQLTQSDANNGGGFSVPRYCADHIFPKLDFEADPPVQNLLMRDPKAKHWQFRHIYRGTPRRHLLTTGWSKFVNAKLLVAGDTVVFMRRPDGELLIGLRRAPRYPVVPKLDAAQQQPPPRNARARVPPADVMEAARLAAEGSPFTVTYFPRQGAAEFVVPRKEVEDALASNWEPGTQVRMQVMEAEDARRIEWANGTVKDLHPNMWRPLEIDWDDSSPFSETRGRYVNTWQVQFVSFPPLLKRLRISDTIAPLCSGDGSYLPAPLIGPESQAMPILLGSPIPAGMQGARHSGPSDDVPPPSSSTMGMLTTQLLFPLPSGGLQMPPSIVSPSGGSSEIFDPEIDSPPNNSVSTPPPELPVEAKSIQLFGATITPHVAPNAASKEVNGAVNRVVDENVGKDE